MQTRFQFQTRYELAQFWNFKIQIHDQNPVLILVSFNIRCKELELGILMIVGTL